MKTAAFLGLGILLAGCAMTPPPDHARIYPGAFGSNGDDDVSAINISSWAFSMSSNTRNRPVEAARAVAAVDYLAGELEYSPRWQFMSPITKNQMLQARGEVRAAIGVAPDAPSQVVVTGLLTAAYALAANDRPAALKALSASAFTRGPEQTLATLQALPFLTEANVATQRASAQAEPPAFGGPG